MHARTDHPRRPRRKAALEAPAVPASTDEPRGRLTLENLRGMLVVIVVAVTLAALWVWDHLPPTARGLHETPMTRSLRAISDGDVATLREQAPLTDLNLYGCTLLCRAAAEGQLDAMRTLMALGVAPNAAHELGLAPIMSAAVAGETEAARLLLEAGADPHVRLRSGETPLTLAEAAGHTDTAALLRERTSKREAK